MHHNYTTHRFPVWHVPTEAIFPRHASAGGYHLYLDSPGSAGLAYALGKHAIVGHLEIKRYYSMDM
jgi:hypothetical protein